MKDFKNKILQGDCIEVMKSIPDNSIDLVVTSPPYNLGIQYSLYEDTIPTDKYYDWCREWLTEIYRVLKNDGRFCLNHYLSMGRSGIRITPLMTLNEMCCKEIGFKHHGLAIINDITLAKKTSWGSWLMASAPYINSPYEGILILYKEDWKKYKKGESTISKKDFMMACSGVWKFGPPERRNHPATFPIKLPSLCINLLTYVGDIVLDPFAGISTTAIAAIKAERNFICIELDPKYVEIANRWVDQELQQGKIF